MMCQRIGRLPTLTNGFGMESENSLNRIPNPPQNKTTFIAILHVNRGAFYYKSDLSIGGGRTDGGQGFWLVKDSMGVTTGKIRTNHSVFV